MQPPPPPAPSPASTPSPWRAPVPVARPPAPPWPPQPGFAAWWSSRRGWLLATLVALATSLLITEAAAVEVAFLAGPLVGDPVLWVGGPLLAAVLGSVTYRAVTGRSVWGERCWRWTDLAWGALFGGLVMGSDLALGLLFDLVVTEPGAPVQGWLDEAMLATPLLVGLGVSIATPFGEEIVSRGLLLRGLAARLPRWVAVAVSSLLFGLLHLERLEPAGLLHVGTAAVAGVLFALAFLRAGHLLAAVTAHVVVNGTYTVLGLLAGGTLVWTVGPAGDVPTIALDAGECAYAAWWDGEPVDAASEVACDGPHDLEVAARQDLPAGPWHEVSLDDPAAGDAADAACLEAFEAYVGVAWESSRLDYVALLPDPERWAAGDRELVCLVVPYEDDVLREPAAGSGH